MSVLSTPRSAARDAVTSLRRPGRRTRRERGFKGLLLVATLIAIAVLAVLLVDIVLDGTSRLDLALIRNYTTRLAEDTGVRAGLTGTLSLMVQTALMAFPVGVGAAVYLEEFAPDNRATRLIEANINNLAGVPSVVYGLLAFGIFAEVVGFGRTLFVGAIALTLLILPVIIVSSREALRAVPQGIRQAGLALGATPLQVTFRQTLPAALPGVLTGTILALSRAVGETAPILVAGAVFSIRQDALPWEFDTSYSALPIQIFDFIKRPQPEFQIDVAAAAIVLLLVVLLAMNSFAIAIRNRYARSE